MCGMHGGRVHAYMMMDAHHHGGGGGIAHYMQRQLMLKLVWLHRDKIILDERHRGGAIGGGAWREVVGMQIALLRHGTIILW